MQDSLIVSSMRLPFCYDRLDLHQKHAPLSCTVIKKPLLLALLALSFLPVKHCVAGTILGFPDVEITGITGTYDFTAGVGGELELEGFAVRYLTSPTESRSIMPGNGNFVKNFQLNSRFDQLGNFVSGNFSVTGTFDGIFGTTLNLLSGTLWESNTSALGFGVLEIKANELGGELGSDYLGGNAVVSFVNLPSTVTNFLSDFQIVSTDGVAADVARPVPEMASVWYLMIGLVGHFSARRRRSESPQ